MINDINSDLILTYKTIKKNVVELIEILKNWETEYHKFKELSEDRKVYYYEKRTLFNYRESDNITQKR